MDAGRGVAEGARAPRGGRSGGRQRRLRRQPHPRGFPDPCYCKFTASRWSISTTPPRRKSRRRCSTALHQAYTTQYANVHRGLHYLDQRGDRSLRGRAGKGGGIPQRRPPEEIIFTRNATEAINLVAYTFGRERIKPGDEIVLSIMEHHSNIVPWHFLRERQGAVIKWAPVDDDGQFPDRRIFEASDHAAPRWSRITHMSNMLARWCR